MVIINDNCFVLMSLLGKVKSYPLCISLQSSFEISLAHEICKSGNHCYHWRNTRAWMRIQNWFSAQLLSFLATLCMKDSWLQLPPFTWFPAEKEEKGRVIHSTLTLWLMYQYNIASSVSFPLSLHPLALSHIHAHGHTHTHTFYGDECFSSHVSISNIFTNY